jgi:predicted RecB family nuclease
MQEDALHLLTAMPQATIDKYKARGITTIFQLSHLFKLRRKKYQPQKPSGFLWALKALAIREKKTYVLQKPVFRKTTTNIYIDFEGLPEENFIYLIGVKINSVEYSYWAEDKSAEEKIFNQLKELLDKYPGANIFHYCSYETKALKKWKLNDLNLINVLSFFRTHVYPPTYTNGLKEIANYLGFEWTEKNASGQQSIEWRKNNQKEKLIQYNLDD